MDNFVNLRPEPAHEHIKSAMIRPRGFISVPSAQFRVEDDGQ